MYKWAFASPIYLIQTRAPEEEIIADGESVEGGRAEQYRVVFQ